MSKRGPVNTNVLKLKSKAVVAKRVYQVYGVYTAMNIIPTVERIITYLCYAPDAIYAQEEFELGNRGYRAVRVVEI
jgi:hypothetical protein